MFCGIPFNVSLIPYTASVVIGVSESSPTFTYLVLIVINVLRVSGYTRPVLLTCYIGSLEAQPESQQNKFHRPGPDTLHPKTDTLHPKTDPNP